LWIIVLLALPAAAYSGYQYRRRVSEKIIGDAETQAAQKIEEAKKLAEAKKRESVLEAKDEVYKLRQEFEREVKERRAEIVRVERRLVQKDETLDKKIEQIERKDEQLTRKDADVQKLKDRAAEIVEKQQSELERVAGLSNEEGRRLLLANVEREVRHEASILIRDVEQEARDEADKRAREIVTVAIQRCAADHTAETTVSVVALPNDEMKGRIIGREGRNIRALETLTGIDLIIDDTPEAVIISGFDPVRREVARIALERLIVDGRIHPARIEEMVEKAQKDVEQRIREEGEKAVFDVGIHNMNPELVKLLGRLRYRTSYGQNVLKHSLEVAHLAGIMAAELGVDVQLAKRAGLLHDLGKAIDHEVEGSHVAIGAEIAKKYREHAQVVNAIASHHGDITATSVESVLVAAADAISAARPGARRESLENYIKRLQKLEEIGSSFEGVDKVYAIQAGREIRIIVKPDRIDDLAAVRVARDISKRIENELEYPGQIRVTVIRETRAVELAK